jgi:hypothetical protein
MTGLILKRASIGWKRHDFDVVEDGVVVGRIFQSPDAPKHRPWMWASSEHKGRPPAYGYEPTRDEAMVMFAKCWRMGNDHRDAGHGGVGELSDNLHTALIAGIQRGLKLPFIVCAVSPNGSVYCIRCNGEAEPEMLAQHVEPEGFRAPVTFMVTDQTGAAVRISVESGRLTFH